MQLPEDDHALLILGAVEGAFASGGGLDGLQRHVLEAVARSVYGLDVGPDHAFAYVLPAELARQAEAHGLHLLDQVVGLTAVLEMVAHPLSAEAAESVRAYARAAGVGSPVFEAALLQAHNHGRLMYADLQRSSWYTKQTVKGITHGRMRELVESKLSYSGFGDSPMVAEKWLALRNCPPGSWGRAVAEFYETHHFPFPGTAHGIYEIGAKHDFVHVLADYEADPEGELDVFGFIATSMPGGEGTVLLAVAMGLFQNGTITTVAGKKVVIARTDTLDDPGAVERFADALRRGSVTTVDVMGGIDHFAHAHRPLAEVREAFNVVPKSV